MLSKLKSKFIVNYRGKYIFEGRQGILLELVTGGDMRYHMVTNNFSENQIKFFVCCIILGLKYFRQNNIIHRDIKPENFILNE